MHQKIFLRILGAPTNFSLVTVCIAEGCILDNRDGEPGGVFLTSGMRSLELKPTHFMTATCTLIQKIFYIRSTNIVAFCALQ
jgi:hypothetical protein